MENPTMTGLYNEHIYCVKRLAAQGLRQKLNSIITAVLFQPCSVCLFHQFSSFMAIYYLLQFHVSYRYRNISPRKWDCLFSCCLLLLVLNSKDIYSEIPPENLSSHVFDQSHGYLKLTIREKNKMANLA